MKPLPRQLMLLLKPKPTTPPLITVPPTPSVSPKMKGTAVKRLSPRLMACLVLLPFALTVSACEKQATRPKRSPPAADLIVKPKPVPGPDILTNAHADSLYNSAVEAWGEDGWAQVARLCAWAKSGDRSIKCDGK